MKNVHLVITDLFLPVDFAAEVCAGLRLPALEKLLARGVSLRSGYVNLSTPSAYFWIRCLRLA